jgi:tRNA(fMet)-specific endonuclease VapC
MIFIDSDCIIDFLKGNGNAKEIIAEYQNEIATSQINVFEIFFGIFNKRNISEKEAILADNFFSSINVFSFDNKCGRIGAKILSDLMKQGNPLNQNDCFIGAIMIKNGVNSIISNNNRHF